MKYLFFILLFLFACKNGDVEEHTTSPDQTDKQVYDICYKSTYDAFKDMTDKMLESVGPEICGNRQEYKDKKYVKLCEQACRDAYNKVTK